ncbi:hypothetical protein L1987_30701 [Smallanthus sonchifolius]|uniref:Uncharacterized protein n=1 Tax=Smallanthus sonchifolius TaxID=185202 RepID=A0ACB9I3I9_9ASTR|nr:hypothetical protein L1987_30701 [Smallanthus sonchifolius]
MITVPYLICLGLEDFYIRRLYLRIQVYSNESVENNPQSSGVQEVNREEVSSDVYSHQRPTNDYVYCEVSYPTQQTDDYIYCEVSYPTQQTDDYVYGEVSYPTQQTDDFVSEDEEQNHQNVSYKTDQNFQSREQLVDWAVRIGRENGYVLVTRRSRRKGDDPTEPFIKVWLVCDRHGERASTATVRRDGSKKIGCPFKLEGEYQENTGDWKLTVKDDSHNHDPSQHLEAHSFARRLSQSEQLLVAKLYSQNMLPRNILATIREQNPESSCIKKDIYNAIQKIKNKTRVGETPMQILENLLSSKKYVYYTRKDPATNIVEEIFFVHSKSFEMWRAFPHVLMIDATYKTNMYRLPFVQVVGVTSTHRSFCVAHAFISKEREENFVWVLLQIKAMLQKCMEPRVIVTDKDKALMNACDKIFLDCSKNLCRCHIHENIAKHCWASFTDEDWANFKYSWSVLCESPTPDIYQYNFNRLYERLYAAKRGRVIYYVTKNWLDPYKEKFVSAWSNKNLNFGQQTTNRVESQHSLLKSYLRNANSSLDRLVGFVDEIVTDQYYQLQFAFGTSLIRKMDSHIAIELFDNLHGKVSHKALNLLENEWYKLSHIRKQNATCGCQLFSSCGLSCACRLVSIEATCGRIPLDALDVLSRKLDLKPSFVDDENVDVDKVLGQVRNKIISEPDQVKRSMLSRIAGVVFPSKSNKKAPVVQEDTRGRPTLKKQQLVRPQTREASLVGFTHSQTVSYAVLMSAHLASAQTLLPAHLASAQTSLPAHLTSAQVPLPAHLASAQDLLCAHLASAHDLFLAKNPNFHIRV